MADQWYLEALQNYLNSSDWRDTIQLFVQMHCGFFVQIEEYHPQQYILWKRFQEVAENLFEKTLRDLGGSLDLLESALDEVKHLPARGPRDEVIKELIDKLLSFEDFDAFAMMMCETYRESLRIEGKKFTEDCDAHTLMRMGFSVDDILSTYDELGERSQLDEMILRLSEKQSLEQTTSRHGGSMKRKLGSEMKVATSMEEGDYLLDPNLTAEEAFLLQQKYPNPIEKLIAEAKEQNILINPNELNAKFVIADSVLSNYQQTVLQNQSLTPNQDQLLLLTRWAAEMKNLQNDLVTAYQEDILCQDLCFNAPKGLIAWYVELERLRHEINHQASSSSANAGSNNGLSDSILSDNELQRMAELDKIAAMGTADEQRLHSLLSRHETIRKDILHLYQKCSILMNTNPAIKRNLIEDVYLLLKEKVSNTSSKRDSYQSEEVMMNDMMMTEVWEDPLITKLIHEENGLEIIHQLLELHILEDEQLLIKREIHDLIGSPGNLSDNMEKSSWNDAKTTRGNDGSSISHLDEMFNFDPSMMNEVYPAEAKESKLSPFSPAKADHSQEKASRFTADDIADSKATSTSLSSPTATKGAMNTRNTELMNSLKNQHHQALQSLKDSLEAMKAKQLSDLENRLLLRKKLVANAKATVSTDPKTIQENQAFIANEEKEIQQLENEIYLKQQQLTTLESAMMEGFKSRCIVELKAAKTVLSDNDSSDMKTGARRDAIDTVEVLVQKIHSQMNPTNDSAANDVTKSIMEKYEKDKAYLLQSLQLQRQKQYQKLQKRLQMKHKANNGSSDSSSLEQEYQDQLQKIDQQFDEDTHATLQALQEHLLLTITGSELSSDLLVSSSQMIGQQRKDEDDDLFANYLQSDEEKLKQQQNLPMISFLSSLNNLKGHYLQASQQLYDRLAHQKLRNAERLQQRRQLRGPGGDPTAPETFLAEEKAIQEEIMSAVDQMLINAFYPHLQEYVEERGQVLLDPDSHQHQLSSLSVSGKFSQKRKAGRGRGVGGNEEEDEEALQERMKAGLLNAYEKSKQSYDAQRKTQQLQGKESLQKRLDQRTKQRGAQHEQEIGIWEDRQVETMMESFLDHFSLSDSASSPLKKQVSSLPSPKPLSTASRDRFEEKHDMKPPTSSDAKEERGGVMNHNSNNSDQDKTRIKALHQEKEKELMDNLYQSMLDKKRKLEERMRKKREDHTLTDYSPREEKEVTHSITTSEPVEKELLDQMQAIEKAYEIMKDSLSSAALTKPGSNGSTNNQNDLARLIAMMETIIHKSEHQETTVTSSDPHPSTVLASRMSTPPIQEINREALAGEARRISTAYTEEQSKLDLMMKIQQTRQRQALQRKLWERNQAKMAAALPPINSKPAERERRRPYHEGEDLEENNDENDSEEEKVGDSIQIAPKRSAFAHAVRGPHQDSVRGLTIPTIAESREKQQSFALRGLNLGPLRRK